MCAHSTYKYTHTFPLSSCNQCLPYVPLCEHHWGLDIVPVLLSVGVNTARTTIAHTSQHRYINDKVVHNPSQSSYQKSLYIILCES